MAISPDSRIGRALKQGGVVVVHLFLEVPHYVLISKDLEDKLAKREMIIASKGDNHFIPITQDLTDEFEQEE